MLVCLFISLGKPGWEGVDAGLAMGTKDTWNEFPKWNLVQFGWGNHVKLTEDILYCWREIHVKRVTKSAPLAVSDQPAFISSRFCFFYISIISISSEKFTPFLFTVYLQYVQHVAKLFFWILGTLNYKLKTLCLTSMSITRLHKFLIVSSGFNFLLDKCVMIQPSHFQGFF